MTNIVWVFGGSASGKETFIRKMMKNPPKKFLNHLGWGDNKIVSVEESMKYIRQFVGDPTAEKRKIIPEKVRKLAKENDSVILIKGQNIDFGFSLLKKIRKDNPNAIHEAIFLHTDPKTAFERMKKKSWWTKELEKKGIEGVKVWVNSQI